MTKPKKKVFHTQEREAWGRVYHNIISTVFKPRFDKKIESVEALVQDQCYTVKNGLLL